MKKVNTEYVFNDFLDTNYNSIKIFDKYEYKVSTVLKTIDPVIYRTALLDFQDKMIKDGQWIYDSKSGEIYEK